MQLQILIVDVAVARAFESEINKNKLEPTWQTKLQELLADLRKSAAEDLQKEIASAPKALRGFVGRREPRNEDSSDGGSSGGGNKGKRNKRKRKVPGPLRGLAPVQSCEHVSCLLHVPAKDKTPEREDWLKDEGKNGLFKVTDDSDLWKGAFGKKPDLNVLTPASDLNYPLRTFLTEEMSMYLTVKADQDYFLQALEADGIVRSSSFLCYVPVVFTYALIISALRSPSACSCSASKVGGAQCPRRPAPLRVRFWSA